MQKNFKFYNELFNKSFFFDKCSFKHIYQCPKILSITLRVNITPKLKIQNRFYKVILWLYLICGQKPYIGIESCRIRNLKKKKIKYLLLTIRKPDNFIRFIAVRQLPLLNFFKKVTLSNISSNVSFTLIQKTQDDDTLAQLLKLPEFFSYQVHLTMNSQSLAWLRTLLINFKIPA